MKTSRPQPLETPSAGTVDAARAKPGAFLTESSKKITPELLGWMAGSKVVDAEGKPMPVYHGTTASFQNFRTPAMFHVEQDYSRYAAGAHPDARVITAYLNIKNPANLDAMHLSPSDPSFKQVAAHLAKQGYDGAHYKNVCWIAFHPSQIRVVSSKPSKIDEAAKPKPASLTDTPSFQAWFKKSKVVDSNGKPLVVYHGSAADDAIGAFKIDQEGTEGGIFFSDNPDVAKMYAGNRGGEHSGRVYAAYLSLQNPYVVDFEGERSHDFYDEMEEAQAGGHDGMILLNVVDSLYDSDKDDGTPENQYVAFKSSQVKALDNNGAFSPDNDNIHEVAKPKVQTDTPAFQAWFGKSKITDADGRPLRVFHGTPTPGFGVFGQTGTNTGNQTSHMGHWFTSDPSVADGFTRKIDHGPFGSDVSDEMTGGVYPVYLKMEKPFVYAPKPEKEKHDALKVIDAELAELRPKLRMLQMRGSITGDGPNQDYYDLSAREAELLKQRRMIAEDDPLCQLMDDRDEFASWYSGAKGVRGAWRARYKEHDSEQATKKFVDALKAKGYDGVILRSTGYDKIDQDASNSDQYVVFSKHQIKSAIGNQGTFSAASAHIAETSDAKQPVDPTQTLAFQNWFAGSQVVDDEGKPLVVYHGSPSDFTVFNKRLIQGRSEGAGFYFTTDKDVARGYGKVYEVYLSIKKPLSYHAKPFSRAQMKRLLLRAADIEAQVNGSDVRDGFLANWGDTYSDTPAQVASQAADVMVKEKLAVDQLGGLIGSGVPPEIVNQALRETLGYDGYVAKGFGGAGMSGGTIYIAMEPSQIKSIANKGTFDPAKEDMYEVVAVKDSSVVSKPSFQAWFTGSKVVDDDGDPLVVYHGTDKDFDTFDVKRSGGRIWFTSSARLAGAYALQANPKSRGAQVKPLYALVKNPFIVHTDKKDGMSGWTRTTDSGLRHLGHDGVFFYGKGRFTTGYVFGSHQLKSAIGNRGAYNPEADDIRESRQIETPAFQAWFRGSTVVDNDGRPLVVYHGTRSSFSKFGYTQDIGYHFGTAGQASRIAQLKGDQRGGGANVMPVYLALKNPVDSPDAFAWYLIRPTLRAMEHAGAITPQEAAKILKMRGSEQKQLNAVRDLLKSKGYDGVRYENETDEGPGTSYIVFDRSQIKSAIANKGGYTGEDITEASKPAKQTDTPAFKAWFGKSKVIDGKGNPLRVFHGTGGYFTVFDNSKTVRGMDKNPHGVPWFSDDPDVAGEFAGSQSGEKIGGAQLGHSNIMPVYLRIEKPFIDRNGTYAKHGGLKSDEVAALRKDGYDGIIWPESDADLPDTTMQGPVTGYRRNSRGEVYGEDVPYPGQYAVFSPQQIKSAIGNRGAFDPKSADIAEAVKPVKQTDTPEFKDWFGNGVIDGSGQPKVVYHASKSHITAFSPQATVDGGFHFGTPEQANMRVSGARKNITPVYLAAQNLRRCRDTGGNWKSKIASAKGAGYDGIVYLNRYEGISTDTVVKAKERGVDLDALTDKQFQKLAPEARDSYIIFDPRLIKSAIGNKGSFSPEGDDITEAAKPVDPTSTPAFQAWFGKSQVVDKAGKPLVVYHGTTQPPFGVFKHNALNDPDRVDIGFHFGTKEQALFRVKGDGDEMPAGGRVDAYYLKAEKPFDMPDLGAFYPSRMAELMHERLGSPESLVKRVEKLEDDGSAAAIHQAYELLRKEFRAHGYDSIRYNNDVEGGGQSFAVFGSHQIKSVGNTAFTGSDNVHESAGDTLVGYHVTDVALEDLKGDLGDARSGGQTRLDVWPEDVPLPKSRLYVSREPQARYSGRYVYKIDISGLEMYPDIPSFADHGAHLEPNTMWWKRLPADPGLRQWLEDHFEDMEVPYEDVTGEDSWRLIGSAVVAGPIARKRVLDVTDTSLKEAAATTSKWPSVAWVQATIRRMYGMPTWARRLQVQAAFVVGSTARGTARPGSDLDIAVIINPVGNRRSVQLTDDFHSRFTSNDHYPKWNGQQVDFQFFYEDDPELRSYSKFKLPQKASVKLRPVDVASPEFKRWFGRSAVVDKDGAPLRVYHGTRRHFTKFDNDEAPDRGGLLAFFSTSPKFASDYAGKSDGSNVMPCYLSIQRLFDFRVDGRDMAMQFVRETGGVSDRYELRRMLLGLNKYEVENESSPKNIKAIDNFNHKTFIDLVAKGSWDALECPEFVAWLRNSEDFDGILTLENKAVNYGVFSQDQIKSALVNTGDYEGEDITETAGATGGHIPDSWHDATGDVVAGDVIRFKEAVFQSGPKPKWLGEREVTARVIKDSYGSDKQQHTFTIEILGSSGFQPLKSGAKTTRKGRTIYRNGVSRLLWEDEAMRGLAADDKHARGDVARKARDARRDNPILETATVTELRDPSKPEDWEKASGYITDLDTSSGSKVPSRKQVTDVIVAAVAKWKIETGMDAHGINCGECDSFAWEVVHALGQRGFRADAEELLADDAGYPSLPSHAFIKAAGLYFDAEAPGGVAHWWELPCYKRWVGWKNTK